MNSTESDKERKESFGMLIPRVSLVFCAWLLAVLVFAGGASAEWVTSVSEDPMTGSKSCYALSDRMPPLRRMGFPYSDVEGWLGIGSDGSEEWAYIGFSTSPNLTNDEIKDGYNVILTRIKWDDEVRNVRLTQDWGSRFLHFTDDQDAISRISQSDSLLLELDWFGEGKVYFEFSLIGSSDAIGTMLAECSQ